MGKVIVSKSMSLDGFVTGPHVSAEQPMGEGGMRLHDWMFKPPIIEINTAVVKELFAATGAVILGKRIFDVGLDVWNDTPYPVPCFVLTHSPREPLAQKSGTFTFVTDGIESALKQAKTAAGNKDVVLMGAATTQQYLKAGLVDELVINLVPVLLGTGTRLFEHPGHEPIELERTRVIEAPGVTHLRFRVVK